MTRLRLFQLATFPGGSWLSSLDNPRYEAQLKARTEKYGEPTIEWFFYEPPTDYWAKREQSDHEVHSPHPQI